MNYFLHSVLYITFICKIVCSQSLAYEESNLMPGKVHNSVRHAGSQRLSIYCYKGTPKHVVDMFQTVFLSLSLQPEEYEVYEGHSREAILEQFEQRQSSWRVQLVSWRSQTIRMNPFNATCVGVDTTADHQATLHLRRVDFWRVTLMAAGLVLYLSASRLSANPLFYYICGVSLGITTSFLILVYLLSKLIPKRPAVYGFLVGGSTIALYLVQLLWQNVRVICHSYQNYVAAYVLGSGLLSFVVCYRFGPVTDPRTKDLIRWSLQGVALAGIFFSSYHQEASLAVILLLLSYYNFPQQWSSALSTTWRKRFPPKTKLLSEDEYHEQGARETIRALDDMRKYCSSPECNQWKTMLRLKHPVRFAEFMEGKSHLIDSELMDYESESGKSRFEVTDDSDSET